MERWCLNAKLMEFLQNKMKRKDAIHNIARTSTLTFHYSSILYIISRLSYIFLFYFLYFLASFIWFLFSFVRIDFFPRNTDLCIPFALTMVMLDGRGHDRPLILQKIGIK